MSAIDFSLVDILGVNFSTHSTVFAQVFNGFRIWKNRSFFSNLLTPNLEVSLSRKTDSMIILFTAKRTCRDAQR